MFCANCGSNVPDGARFCDNCGAPQNAAPQANSFDVSTPTTPVPAPAPSNGPEPGLSKSKFLSSKKLDAQTKRLVMISWGLLAACLLVLILAVNTTINGKAHKIPVFGMVMGSNFEDEVDDMLDEAEDRLDDLEDELDRVSGSKKDDIEREIEAAEKLIKKFSMANIRDYISAKGDSSDAAAFGVFITAAVVLCVIAAVFLLLGGLLRSTALVVIGLFPAMVLTGFLSGILYLALVIAGFISLAVIISKLNGAYKAYKSGANSAPVMF